MSDPRNRRKAVAYTFADCEQTCEPDAELRTQRHLLTDYATNAGIEIVAFYQDIDVYDGRDRQRYGGMIKFLNENSEVRVVLVDGIDRLTGKLEDRQVLRDLGVEIHAARNREFTGAGVLLPGAGEWNAEMDSMGDKTDEIFFRAH